MNLSSISLALFTLAALGLCSPSHAQQSAPRPPTITAVDGSPSIFSSGNYDLSAAMAQVPFDVQLPTNPIITSEALCTTEAEIISSLSVNGRRTIIAPGNYSLGHITVGGDNKHIVGQAGVNLSLGGFSFSSATAILLENVSLTTTSAFAHSINNSQSITFKNVTTQANDSGFYLRDSSRVLLLSVGLTAAMGPMYISSGNDTLIIANSNLESLRPPFTNNGWAVRWASALGLPRSVFMDSRFRAVENAVLRYENTQQLGYFARNHIESGAYASFITSNTSPLEDLWFIDNKMYAVSVSGSNGRSNVQVQQYPQMTNVVATGNRTFGPTNVVNAGFGSGTQPTWTTSNNVHTLTSGYAAPPVWEMK